jgi:hypothetical protein
MALVNPAMGYSGESGGIGTYTDVSPGDWFYSDVSPRWQPGIFPGHQAAPFLLPP